MRPLPTSKLDPRIKMVWRLNDALWITIAALCVVLPLWLISLDADEPLLFTAAVVAAAIAVALYLSLIHI